MSTVQTRIQLKRDTKANWNTATGFVPLRGEVIIYEDFAQYEVEKYGETVTKYIPNIKIGDGTTPVQDLPFVDKDLRDKLMEHINDQDIHVALGDKKYWDYKIDILNCIKEDKSSGVDSDGVLTFTREDWLPFNRPIRSWEDEL